MSEEAPKRMPGERNHLLLGASLGFLGGCLCFGYVSGGWWIWILALLSLGLGVAFLNWGKPLFLPVLILFFAFGLLRTQAQLNISQPAAGKYEINATVSGEPTVSDGKIKMTLVEIALDGEPVEGKAYCTLTTTYWETTPPELFDGARIRLEAKVYLPEGKSGEPHFDFERWMYTKGYAFGISGYEAYELENTAEEAPVTDLASRIRAGIKRRLSVTMGENASLAMAVLFGDKSGLSDEDYDSFRTLGIAHLMSVSGLHIGLMAAMLMKLLDLLHADRRIRLPFLVLFLFGYAALCGFSASAVRAAIMFTVMFSARLLFRARDRLTVLALASLIILLVNPLECTSAGYVLSFSAMLGIYGFAPAIQDFLGRIWSPAKKNGEKDRKLPLRDSLRKCWKALSSSFALTVGAQIGTVLPTVCYYHQLPTYGLVMNLLLVPIVGTVMTPIFFVSSLLCWVPGLSVLLGNLSAFLTEGFLQVISLLSTLPGATLRVAMPGLMLGIGIVLGLLILSRLIPGCWLWKLPIAVTVFALALGINALTTTSPCEYIQISTGQADCALIMDGDRTIVIDTGNEGGELLDYLLYEGRNIDELYITHPHLDHIGGLRKLLEEDISIGCIYYPEGIALVEKDKGVQEIMDLAAQKGIPCVELSAGDTRSYEHFTFHILWPYAGRVRKNSDANDNSMVIAVQLEEYTLLAMGDLTGSYENYVYTPANVLKVAHHGSKSSTGESFLTEVNPGLAVITCSSSSRSLPSQSTLDRLQNLGCSLLRTDTAGDIRIQVKDDRLVITPYRGDVLP